MLAIFKNGEAVKSIRFRGKSAIIAYLGDQIVWDGRSSAYRFVPVTNVAAVARPPQLFADALVTVPLAARGYGETAYPADMDAGVTIAAPVVGVDVSGADVEASNDRVIDVPAVVGVSGTAYAAPAFEVTGAVVTATTASGSTDVLAPDDVTSTVSVGAPRAVVVGEVKPPVTVRGGWTVTAVPATGAAQAEVPTWEVITFTDAQMIKTANQSISGTYATITNMVPDSGYPDSNVTGGQSLVVSGASGNATVTVRAIGSKASNSYWVYFRVMVNGAMVGTEQIRSGTPNSYTFDFTIPGVVLNDGDVIELQARRTGTASVFTGTYLRVTA